jgi:hypothetical protein
MTLSNMDVREEIKGVEPLLTILYKNSILTFFQGKILIFSLFFSQRICVSFCNTLEKSLWTTMF